MKSRATHSVRSSETSPKTKNTNKAKKPARSQQARPSRPPTAIDRVPKPFGLSRPRSSEDQPSSGAASLIQGLQNNYGPSAETVEKVKEVTDTTKTVASNSNNLSTLSKTAAQVGQARGAEKAAAGLSEVSKSSGKLGEGAAAVARPLSAANAASELLDKEASSEDKVSAATTLASDATYGAKTLGAAASAEGVSALKPLAAVQNGVAGAAPGAASKLATVGKVAPVAGGVASVVSGGLQLKDSLSGDKIDKAGAVSGGLKVASGVALAIPGGAPVAAGLTVASLAIDHRETIAKGVGKAVDGGKELLGKIF